MAENRDAILADFQVILLASRKTFSHAQRKCVIRLWMLRVDDIDNNSRQFEGENPERFLGLIFPIDSRESNRICNLSIKSC